MQLATLWLLWFLRAVWRLACWKGFENWAYQPWPANCQWGRMNYSAIILKVKEVPRNNSSKEQDWHGMKAWSVTAVTIKMLSLSSKGGQEQLCAWWSLDKVTTLYQVHDNLFKYGMQYHIAFLHPPTFLNASVLFTRTCTWICS